MLVHTDIMAPVVWSSVMLVHTDSTVEQCNVSTH